MCYFLTAGLSHFKTIFNKKQEEEIVDHVKHLESLLLGITSKDLRKLAYELAEKNKLKHNFNQDTKLAGKKWSEDFMKRHPTLSLRKPEATSAARAMGFNKVVVENFFKLLTEAVDKNTLTAGQIFNCDEIGISAVPKSLSKVIATKGKRQVGSLTSAERGQTVTMEICMCADGRYMPPCSFFPGKD